MKCLIIFSGNTISGAEIVLQDYLKNRKDQNIEFYAVCSSKKIKEFLIESGIKPQNVNVSILLSQLGITKSNLFVKAFLLITKIILVILAKLYIQIISKLKSIDVILGKNTYDALYFPPLKGKVRNILYIHDILKKDIISRYIRKIIQKKVDHVIAVSNEVKSSLGKKLENKVSVVYNGTKISNQIAPLKTTSTPRLIWIGSIEKRKNPLEFVQMINQITSKTPEIKGLIIYKYYQKDLLSELHREISDKPYIEIKHNLTREEVINEIKNSTAIVITSTEDPLPTVILESYSLGIPVISANRSGMREMVIHYKTGILYNSIEEIVNSWEDILRFFIQQRSEIVQNIQQLLTSKFSIEEQLTQIDKIILGSNTSISSSSNI
ncbi:MAG: glycosyltransferase family 4 protein [Brevinematales bacterium]|nr:glycosyltransferase family 4 protein [Brevinematales bacterium]